MHLGGNLFQPLMHQNEFVNSIDQDEVEPLHLDLQCLPSYSLKCHHGIAWLKHSFFSFLDINFVIFYFGILRVYICLFFTGPF